MRRKLLLGITVILAAIPVIYCITMAVPTAYLLASWEVQRWQIEARRHRNAIPFDKEAWQAATQENEHGREFTREYMVDDLLGRYDFKDWHRRDVEDLLGKPDWAPADHPWIQYTLSLYLNYLHFEFDKDGLVKHYFVEWENYP